MVQSSDFKEVVQIDHINFTTDTGCNQILVVTDCFKKLAEAVPCQTAAAQIRDPKKNEIVGKLAI